jgi:coenzyme F420-reducing hydrogenase delta subunit
LNQLARRNKKLKSRLPSVEKSFEEVENHKDKLRSVKQSYNEIKKLCEVN